VRELRKLCGRERITCRKERDSSRKRARNATQMNGSYLSGRIKEEEKNGLNGETGDGRKGNRSKNSHRDRTELSEKQKKLYKNKSQQGRRGIKLGGGKEMRLETHTAEPNITTRGLRSGALLQPLLQSQPGRKGKIKSQT